MVMATTVGLRIALTLFGMIDLVIPNLYGSKLERHQRLAKCCLSNLLIRIQLTRSKSRFLLRQLKHGVINTIRPPRSALLELPGEIRYQIWQAVCTPGVDGRLPGILNLMLINTQIHSEALPLFDQVEHTIKIGDTERYKAGSIEFMGLPRLMKIDESLTWHMASLKHLVLVVSVCGIGIMTPDCFDVLIAHNGKEQWRNLKRLIGIWPETREVPLDTVRLDLHKSGYNPKHKTYRADFIRLIRNFKRTRVWAETGDCSKRKGNASILLPLVKAFNQGRRNWLEQSNADNNLIVRYDTHILGKGPLAAAQEDDPEKAEEERRRWSIVPTDDTSRSDSAVWPEWSGKEEKYIHDKMIPREKECEYECRECLAAFDKPGELRHHFVRGRARC